VVVEINKIHVRMSIEGWNQFWKYFGSALVFGTGRVWSMRGSCGEEMCVYWEYVEKYEKTRRNREVEKGEDITEIVVCCLGLLVVGVVGGWGCCCWVVGSGSSCC